MGARIRAARLRRRMSQVEMAERMGVDRNTLLSLERGELSVGLGVMVRALGVLGMEDDLEDIARPHLLIDDRLRKLRRRWVMPAAGGHQGPDGHDEEDHEHD